MIKLQDYQNNEDITWSVYSDCKSVRIKSTFFEIERNFDYVTIDDTKSYTGSPIIDTIGSTNFTVAFRSDYFTTKKGFVLNWNCLSQWEAWTGLGDGTCRDALGTQPPFNGGKSLSDREYWTKYRRRNKTCSKFFFTFCSNGNL